VDPINEFRKEVAGNIEAQGKDHDIQDLSMRWFLEAQRNRYSYNFSWLGRPIIQYPQDIVAMQELIWSVKPDLIIETGIVSKSVEDIDLRTIDDTNFQQRFLERLLGIGNVTIVSSDKVAPTYVLRGIADPRGIREMIRTHVYQVSQRQLFTRAT